MNVLDVIRFLACAVCVLGGLFVILSGVLGVFRFRSALSRMHAAALIDTIGLLLMLLGLMIAQGLDVTSGKLAVIILLLWLTSPVSSHLLGRMEVTINDELDQNMNVRDREMVRREKEGD